MLKIATGRFGLYCEVLSKQTVERTQQSCKALVVHQPALRALSTLSKNTHQSQISRETTLLLRQFSNQQNYVHTLYIVVPGLQRSLRASLNYRNATLKNSNYRNVGTLPKVMSRFARFLRIRYFVLTGAITGGIAANQTIDSWKKYIPDVEWLKDYIPDQEKREKFFKPFREAREAFGKLPISEKGWLKNKLGEIDMKGWLEQASFKGAFDEGKVSMDIIGPKDRDAEMSSSAALPKLSSYVTRETGTSGKDKYTPAQGETRNRQDELNEEIMKIQTKYQKELDRLEKENRDLRKQISLLDQRPGQKRKMNTSLIDMYSEILDVLTEFDSSYNTQDHLPRVVVVGDQSAGKTSVLEMIARARIFPRGSGEMMTRSPVKVTLSEGPYHVAQFKDSSREFDLTNPAETEALRREVEVRMKKSVSKGQTVSNECISMSVKGPGIQRMVLVDLPGIISTETTIMAPDTKDNIKRLVRSYMENPNAIILCIQDYKFAQLFSIMSGSLFSFLAEHNLLILRDFNGSLDAERSNVTDVVSQIDPSGKRTIFVLTKVDLAENNLYNPNRIKSILEGKLFPMKALGYFAVVTGKGNTNDSIESIREYEDQFFRNSRLLKDGALKHKQMNTQNLSLAVSELFWKMVKENIEQQADAFKATRFNLETEWKNNFPRLRELDRAELFEKAKGEILDEVINLSLVTAKQWEQLFHKKLWDKTATHVFENIYLPAAQSESIGEFNTVIDIKLTDWANHALPKKSVEVGWDALHEEFLRLIRKEGKKMKTGIHDMLFDKLKYAVIDASKSTHNWDGKAEDSLRVIQRNTLEDRSVHDRQQWDAAINFMEATLKEQLKRNEETLKDLTGPGSWEQWRHWRSQTHEHKNRIATVNELYRILKPQHRHKPFLSQDELTTIRQTLQSQGIEVDTEFIKQTWYHVFRDKFIKKALQQCTDCKKGFYLYQNDIKNSGLDCHEVVLFWRLQRMLDVTSNALRQQVINNEARRLERIIKDVLDDFANDKDGLKKLLTGRPVELAEEIKKVRQIQEKLEEFIEALNREK